MDLPLNEYDYNITIIIKNTPTNDSDFNIGTYKLDFKNSFCRVDGGYMVVETRGEDSIIGQVFDLKLIKSYKIWQ
jgi:hypothetical protein